MAVVIPFDMLSIAESDILPNAEMAGFILSCHVC